MSTMKGYAGRYKFLDDVEITKEMVPFYSDGLGKISSFALTIDGYGEAGSFEEAMEYTKLSQYSTLKEARIALFAFARGFQYWTNGPDFETKEKIVKALDYIRCHVKG